MKKCSFLGLGIMGAPMARFLLQKGYSVKVYNRNLSKAEGWLKKLKTQIPESLYRQGRVCRTIKEAVHDSDFVFACVSDDPDAQEVAFSAFRNMKVRSCYIDHTTTSEKLAILLEQQAHKKHICFLDAPVSGGQSGAENGMLTIMVGGEAKTFEKVKPVLESYGKNIIHIGEAGSGQLAKMVNQICIAGILQGLAEGIHFAKKSRLDTDAVFSAIKNGAAQSWQMDNRFESMVKGEFDFGFAVSLMRKDLRITLEAAREKKAGLPLTALIDQFYADLEAMGIEKYDTSSLLKRLENFY